MSIKTIQVVQDDIDGTAGASTVSFAFEGIAYEIDLNETHATRMRESMQVWIDNARRARGRAATGRRASTSTGSSTTGNVSPLRGRSTPLTEKGLTATVVREWAHANGVEVNERGRIPDAIIEQYATAMNTSAAAPEGDPSGDTPETPTKTSARKAPAKKVAARKRTAKKATAALASKGS
jgi:hypothetical protein